VKKLLLSSLMLLAITPPLLAAEIQIGAGGASGEYTNTIVPAISEALKKQGMSAKAVVSAGSQENIDKVMSGEFQAGLSQLDVAALNMTKEKDPDENLILMGKISPEALFCAVKKDGKIKSYADLTDKQEQPLKVSVGGEKSGTAKTFSYIMKLDSDLKAIEFSDKEDIDAELDRLASGRRDLVCFVMMPNPDNARIKRVMESQDLAFISIDKPVFTTAEVSGVKVYNIAEVPVSGGFFGLNQKKIKTLVTWTGVVVNTAKTPKDVQKALRDIVGKPDLLPATSIAAQAKGMMDKIINLVH
jgi:TRAP transporter TAXI family solute receptor